MEKTENKDLKQFIDAINRDAENECEKIMRDAKAYKKAKLASVKEKITKDNQNRIKHEISRIRSESNKEIASLDSKMRLELTKKRDEIEKSVFEEVEKKLDKFFDTADYKALLLRSAEQIGKTLQGDNLVIYLDDEDIVYAEDVKKVVGRECRVEEDDTITLGGLKASTDTFTADDTIQCRLEAMKSWFRENSGLEIV